MSVTCVPAHAGDGSDAGPFGDQQVPGSQEDQGCNLAGFHAKFAADMRKKSPKKAPRRIETLHAESQRKRILSTAKDRLLKGGPDAVVFRDIANELGMHHSNVQYYYRTRHDLLVAIFDQEATKYTEEVRVAVAAAPKRQARVAALIDTILKLLRAPDTALWRLIIGMLDHNAEMAAVHRKQILNYSDALMEEVKLIFPKLPLRRRQRIVITIQTVIAGLAVHFAHFAPGSVESRLVETCIREVLVELIELESSSS